MPTHGSSGGATLANTSVVASATQPADAGSCASCATQPPEERTCSTEERHAEVNGREPYLQLMLQIFLLLYLRLV